MMKLESAFSILRCRYPRWVHLVLAATIVLGLGMVQSAAAKKPILTKSGKNAALEQAAADIFPAPTGPAPLGPAGPTDETKVPHYFGPFPNWANSPFTLPDVAVEIVGDGAGATATATVGAGGAVTGITITNPGSGYTSNPMVVITGAGTGAEAEAVISASGVVTAINMDVDPATGEIIGGAGYTAPVVAITDSTGPGSGATATAYGGVDAVALTNPGTAGYQLPTVDFDMPDGPDGVKATAHAVYDPTTGVISEIVVDSPGSGYSFAPNVVIRDGTIFDPIRDGGSGALATATLEIQTVVLDTFGAGYDGTSTVAVDITDSDGIGAGASATAVTNAGAVTAINLASPGFGGSGYLTAGGMKKFQDGLPMLCDPSVLDPTAAGSCAAAESNLGQYLPLAVPDTTTFTTANGFADDADYYVIALVQTREQMHSDLPPTLLREYVQLETPANASWSKSVLLETHLLDGTTAPTLMPDGSQAVAVDDPHFLGPVIVAQKNRPVRIVFYNLLPKGTGGDLFLPKDSTIMGSGYGPPMSLVVPSDTGEVVDEVRNPRCTDIPSDPECFQDNRATLHLHGGITPWISDGTPHQWITPADEIMPYNTSHPQGVSVGNVPDMATPESIALGVPDCSGERDGCQTFYYTNQQSARLAFYHDHAWGITRLNVYAGEAAGYLIIDPTEQALFGPGGTFAELGEGIPLVIQDRTFVPSDHRLTVDDPLTQLDLQDPTWDTTRWGGRGNLWYHHVYMPAQNPGDPTGMTPFGRWMYGPWFWPPATPPHGPIANPYYNMDPATGFMTPLAVPCNLDDPTTWQYGTDPFCEPELIPGTPNIAAGMEQFNDTPIVNGTAYPTTTVEPKPYRLRILNAANDRFWNLQWYVADPASETDPAIGPTEVALNPAELAAAQIDPNIFPTPVQSPETAGPDWIMIGSEGGFLPAPVVVDGQQPTTWIIDPTVFNVGNVDQHSLLLGSAERADVIVDFSAFAGQTLILYNDAPAAFPARVASYDYYTGAPDLWPVGAPPILPGYGPNTRTIMQVKVADTTPAPAFDLAALQAAFRHKADGSGVFESGQHPIIVGQEGYDSAYGTNFAAGGYCNGGSTSTSCDGYLRIADQGGTLFGFNTLLAPDTKLEIPIEPKAIHDEMNASAFDEFGRMQANIGLSKVPSTPGTANAVLYPYVNPPTEMFDATLLPKDGEIDMTPIKMADGTQIWKITHNGVDTHPLHWHLYDVQVLNRVTWDNIVSPPHATELGWKDTLRVSPLEDTIVALRPIIPKLPFQLPNAIRPLHPMIPIGATMGFNNVDADGIATNPIVNALVNFGLEYVWHCHILSHEEMDMMRPVSVALPPITPDGLAWVTSGTGAETTLELTWNDNSLNETSFLVQRSPDGGATWHTLRTISWPLVDPNTTGILSFIDTTFRWNETTYSYRIVAQNRVGYGGEYMSLTPESVSEVVVVERCYANIAPNPLDMNVDAVDLAALVADFGRANCLSTGPVCPGDIEPIGAPDGDVDASDLSAMSQEFGRTNCPVF